MRNEHGMLDLTPDRAFEFYRSFLYWYCSWYNPRYLEIGCAAGSMTCTLPVREATGIDIVKHEDWDVYRTKHLHVKFFKTTSDKFFKTESNWGAQWDLIFIDGDHESRQVLRDVKNSLLHLAEGGLIVMHDTYPPTMDYTDDKLCGTAYLVAQELRRQNDLEVYTFPVTYGVTLVSRIGSGFPWR